MPTRSGVATLCTALLCLLAGRIFGIFELYIVAAAMIALVCCAVVWVLLNWRSLDVSRVVNPPRLHAGQTSTVTLQLVNRRFLPTPVAQITDEVEGSTRADAHVPPIRRDGNTRASYRVPTQRRGLIAIGPMKTRVTDPFGLASSTSTSAADTHLLVLPRIDVITAPPQPGGSVGQQADRSPQRVGANGDEFSSLRAYAVGDDLRKVHWPSSARLGEMVVRNEHIPEHGHSLVALDVRAAACDEPTFERMVSATASILVACQQRGDQVRFITTSGLDITADTPAKFERALDALATITQSPSATLSLPFELGRSGVEAGALVVAYDSETLIAAVSSGRGSRSTMVVRFYGEKPRTQRSTSRLPSSRMIEVRHGEQFAPAWNRALSSGTTRSR